MKLPQLPHADRILLREQWKFGGYTHTDAAEDGDLFDMENLSSFRYPRLSPRRGRIFLGHAEEPNAIFSDGKSLLLVDGEQLYYGGQKIATVENSKKQCAAFQNGIVIFPDKLFLDTETLSVKHLEEIYTAPSGSLHFGDGLYAEEEAQANSLVTDGDVYGFAVGDAVEISGCIDHPENNQTLIVREISEDGRTLRFLENSFARAEDGAAYTESGTVTLARRLPSMTMIFECENRLWGCDGRTIYASKLGDASNFYVFDGLSSDSYAIESGSAGDFTGAAVCMGMPTFFKENEIFCIYGTRPMNYELERQVGYGVAPQAQDTVFPVGSGLFYLSRAGVCSYAGSRPEVVSIPLGCSFEGYACSGGDMRRYYFSGKESGGRQSLFVYDSLYGLWHREDASEAFGFAFLQGRLYMLTASGDLWQILTGDEEGESELPDFGLAREEGTVESDLATLASSVTFSEIFMDRTEHKGITRLALSLDLPAGASIKAYLSYDGGAYQLVGEGKSEELSSPCLLPLIPRRCERMRLKLEGIGDWTLRGVSVEYYRGSFLH